MLSRFPKKVARFLSSEDGPTSVEYAILLAIIVGAIVTSVGYVGTEVRETHEAIGASLNGALND
jgi:pilus assembly protein Flp/PilA